MIPLTSFMCLTISAVRILGPPSRLTSNRWGVGMPILSSRRRHTRLSQRTFCMGTSFTQNGLRALTYAIAFSSGKPSE